MQHSQNLYYDDNLPAAFPFPTANLNGPRENSWVDPQTKPSGGTFIMVLPNNQMAPYPAGLPLPHYYTVPKSDEEGRKFRHRFLFIVGCSAILVIVFVVIVIICMKNAKDYQQEKRRHH